MSSLSIGLSGLQVSQRLLDLAGQNIANANTPGYHREVADLGYGRWFNWLCVHRDGPCKNGPDPPSRIIAADRPNGRWFHSGTGGSSGIPVLSRRGLRGEYILQNECVGVIGMT